MVLNTHERVLSAPASKVGELTDRLASPDDLLWPRDRWPAMRFDRPLEVGALGGHGPIRYLIEAYVPGHSIRFQFTAPRGFLGTHGFYIEEISPGAVRLRHVLEMELEGLARISWPLFFRPLHNALIEDALDRAEAYVGSKPRKSRGWPAWVRLLRWAASRRRPKE